jgi:hypothetical protein
MSEQSPPQRVSFRENSSQQTTSTPTTDLGNIYTYLFRNQTLLTQILCDWVITKEECRTKASFHRNTVLLRGSENVTLMEFSWSQYGNDTAVQLSRSTALEEYICFTAASLSSAYSVPHLLLGRWYQTLAYHWYPLKLNNFGRGHVFFILWYIYIYVNITGWFFQNSLGIWR